MTRKAGLNSNTLKLLAVVALICQHVTIFFIPTTNPWYYPLFCFGMITAPIMCFSSPRGIITPTAAESTWSCCCCITASGAARASGTSGGIT